MLMTHVIHRISRKDKTGIQYHYKFYILYSIYLCSAQHTTYKHYSIAAFVGAAATTAVASV